MALIFGQGDSVDGTAPRAVAHMRPMRCSIGAKKRSKQSLRKKPAITGGLELPNGIEQRCTSKVRYSGLVALLNFS